MKRTSIVYDYSQLLSRIDSFRYSQAKLAKAVDMSRTSLNLKLNNRATFSQPEILLISKVLEISENDIGKYFFTLFVQKTVQNVQLV